MDFRWKSFSPLYTKRWSRRPHGYRIDRECQAARHVVVRLGCASGEGSQGDIEGTPTRLALETFLIQRGPA